MGIVRSGARARAKPGAAILVAALSALGAVPAIQKGGLVDANGVRIAYESFGGSDRETILLVAGTGQQLVDWPKPLIDDLVRRGYRVVTYDNRDVGLSTRFTAAGLPDAAAIGKAIQEGKAAPLPYALRDMANDAVGLLDALGIRQAHIAGISMGGGIAQLVAIEHPERVLSLTSMMADSGNPALPVVAQPAAFAQLPPVPPAGDREAFIAYRIKTDQVLAGPRYPVGEKELRDRVERAVRRSYDPAGLLRQQTIAFLGHYDPVRLAGLKGIRVPTVVVQGTADPIVALEAARDIAANIPDADLRIIEGLGHSIPVALVPQFADAIVAAARRAVTPR